MKSSEPIRVKINTLRGRDWPKAGHCCLESRAHVGARTLIRAFICRDPTSKIRPCQVLLCYWSSCRNQLLPPLPPPLPSPPCFSIREERKYPSRELDGLARAAAPSLEARELRSDISHRSPQRPENTKTKRRRYDI